MDADVFVKMKDVLIAAFPFFGGRSGVGGGLGCRGAGASELRRDGDGRWLCGLCDCHPLWRRASFLPWQ